MLGESKASSVLLSASACTHVTLSLIIQNPCYTNSQMSLICTAPFPQVPFTHLRLSLLHMLRKIFQNTSWPKSQLLNMSGVQNRTSTLCSTKIESPQWICQISEQLQNMAQRSRLWQHRCAGLKRILKKELCWCKLIVKSYLLSHYNFL